MTCRLSAALSKFALSSNDNAADRAIYILNGSETTLFRVC